MINQTDNQECVDISAHTEALYAAYRRHQHALQDHKWHADSLLAQVLTRDAWDSVCDAWDARFQLILAWERRGIRACRI